MYADNETLRTEIKSWENVQGTDGDGCVGAVLSGMALNAAAIEYNINYKNINYQKYKSFKYQK